MRILCALLIFLCSSSLWSSDIQDQKDVPIYGDLEIPKDYVQHQKEIEQRDQVIPTAASKTTSPGAFGGKILEYHLADVLEHNQFKPLKSVKDFEESVNSNTNIETSGFKLKSKLDLNRLQAEMDIETFVNTRVWTEDSFKTLRAQMILYDIESGLISIESKTNKDDSRTYLNLEKTW